MKTLLRAGAVALALLSCSPALAQHATDSRAPAGFAPETACVTWSGGNTGDGALVPCPATPLGIPKDVPLPRFSAGFAGHVPAATPYDVLGLRSNSWKYALVLRRITISGAADAGATIDVLVQRSGAYNTGTRTTLNIGNVGAIPRTTIAGYPFVYDANGVQGDADGVSATRPIVGQGKMTFASSTGAGSAFSIQWERGEGPRVKNLNTEQLVVSLRGAALPANAKLSYAMEWDEQRVPLIAMVGSSSISNAPEMYDTFWQAGRLADATTILNRGSNGYRLIDYLLHTNGVTYNQATVIGYQPDVMVFSYGANDVRSGATSTAQLISMIDAAIYATLNGTIAGQTYTSPKGAGTTFTWPATIAADPDAKIVLWGPHAFASDDFTGTGAVTTTGLFAGMTLAQAAQAASTIMYDAYQAFAGDPRIFRLVQKQDVFGRTVQTGAQSGLMADQLHQNARGKVLSARQIAPVLIDASRAAYQLFY